MSNVISRAVARMMPGELIKELFKDEINGKMVNLYKDIAGRQYMAQGERKVMFRVYLSEEIQAEFKLLKMLEEIMEAENAKDKDSV